MTRAPRQARALHKVELVLEAAARLIDEDGVDALTTNAVAARAGVSIGTLYQYFDDKQALLDALIDRHVQTLATRVRASLSRAALQPPGERVRALVQAVLASYGGRRRVHRRLMAHALTRGPGTRLAPLYAEIANHLAGQRAGGSDGAAPPLTQAQAFVLTHAIAGVLRALAGAEHAPPRAEVEDALVRLVAGFVSPPR